MQKVRKAVIPAAGYGTRFLPITKIIPKELLPIGNKPAIQYVVEEAVEAGIEEIILVCNPHKVPIADFFRPDRYLNRFLENQNKQKEIAELKRIESLARITVVYQEEAMGLGHSILCAEDAVEGEPFLVMLPDVLILPAHTGAKQLVEECHKKMTWGFLLERVPKEKISSYGIVKSVINPQGDYVIHGAVEKPKVEDAPSDLSLLGRYLLPGDIFQYIDQQKKGAKGEVQLTDALNDMAQKTPALGILNSGKIFDVGTPEGLSEIYFHLKSH